MSLPVFHLAMLAELAWAGFGSLRLGLGMGAGRGGGWGAVVWLLGAVAIPVAAGLVAWRRHDRRQPN